MTLLCLRNDLRLRPVPWRSVGKSLTGTGCNFRWVLSGNETNRTASIDRLVPPAS